MHSALSVSRVRFTEARPLDAQTGLLGYASFVVNSALHFDHVAVRRGRAGTLSLSYRAIDLANGDRRYPVRPTGESARIAIEQQVFAALRCRGVLP